MRTCITLLIISALCGPGFTQAKPGSGTQGQYITHLRQMEDKAKNDVAQLIEAAAYAKQHGLLKDQDRILNKVLKLDPDNAPAHKALGFEKYKGEWMKKEKAQALEKADTEAAMKAKGMEWYEGVWLPADQLEDAKRGLFRWENEIVTKEEYKQLAGGKVRHPRTGEIIEKADLDKASKQFPLGGGKWGEESEANKFHAGLARPWVVRTTYCTILSNAALSDVESIKAPAAEAYETCKLLLGKEPSPKNRLVIYMAAESEDYRELGTRMGDEGSSYGAFLSAPEVEVHGLGAASRIAICNCIKDWAPYYTRHAVGLVYLMAVTKDAGIDDPPLWLLRGVAGFAERFSTDGHASHFAKLHIEKGGVTGLTSFFKTFAINAEMESKAIDAAIFQAALILDFGRRGPDKQVKDAFAAMQAALGKGGKEFEKSVKEYEKAVGAKEKELREYLKDLSKKT
jgi:hypothetical protein